MDAVLYFEGERNLSYRILRAIKNRYGSTNEIGVFEMGDSGLDEVSNPSQAMLEGRPENVSGTCVACVIEGSRPILAEVQALVSKSGYPSPRRMATGFDYNRLALLLAVLEKRCGYFFGTLDTYNLGGTKIAMVLQKIFCDTILGYHLVDKQILKSAFDIERLKYRKNIPIALPHVGITRAWISCLEFNYQGAGKRRTHRMSLDDVVRDDEIYSVMEHDLNRENVPLNVIVIKFVRIILEIEWNNCKRRMTIELTRNSCTLKSNADELRKIGEYFIQENGIDVQPNLF